MIWIGIIIGIVFMMCLRHIIYKINEYAYKIHLKQQEDNEILNQYLNTLEESGKQ